MMRQCSAVSFHRFLTFCSSPAKVLSHLRLRLTTRSLEISGTRVTNDYLRRRVNRKSKKKGEIKNKKACDPCECGKMRFTAERIESSFCKRVSVIFKSLTVNIHFLIRNVYGALWEEFEGAVDVCRRNQNLLVLYLMIMMMMFVLGVSFKNARYYYQMLLLSSLLSSSYYCVCYFVFTPKVSQTCVCDFF